MNKHSKVIIITGASSGIGLACAEYLACKGHVVYGIGRNPDFKTTCFSYSSIDIRNEADINEIVSVILQKETRIDLLINNAGIHIAGAVEHTSHQAAQHLFECNFFGSLNMIRAVLPSMKERKSGMIICISSIGGVTGLPFQGIYCASKFALEGLCESLRMETSCLGIEVVLLEPGDFQTPITRNRIIDSTTKSDPYYDKQFAETLKKITSDETNGMAPRYIARKVDKVMRLKKPGMRYTAGKLIQRSVPVMKRLLPSEFFQYIIQKNYYA